MLNPTYRYLTFDFETTGLDTRKDEPIQIGIVEFDHTFKIISTYTSLIKPKKNIKELKSIVQHVTGFSLDQLEEAPSMEEIVPEIQSYFDSSTPTIVIGHNISFDLAILKRFLRRTPSHSIDTYIYAKALLHYVPSYSLETLNEYLKKSDNHRQPKTIDQEGSAHDALYDCFLAYNLFEKLITKIQHLRKNHLLVDVTLEKNNEILGTLIQRSQKNYTMENKKLFFPPLHSSVSSSHKKIIQKEYLDLGLIPDKETGNISTLTPKSFLHHIDWGKKKRVISVNHKAKVALLERIFKDMNFTPDTLHDQVIFDPERVNTFVQQETHQDEESLFILKYHSQLSKKHSLLDINSQHEYKIFYALAGQKKSGTSPLTLCTHEQLFTIKHSIGEEHTLLFMDKDWRYQSYQKVLKKSFDPLYLLNHLEQVSYKYSLHQHELAPQIEKLSTTGVFLIALLHVELNPFFSGGDIKRIDVTDIGADTRFPKTQALLKKRKNALENITGKLLPEDEGLFVKCTDLIHYLTSSTTISKRMYNGDKWYYTFQDSQMYVQRNEFLSALPEAGKTAFLSSSKKQEHNNRNKNQKKSQFEQTDILLPHLMGSTTDLNVQTITKIPKLTERITHSGISSFCISSSKERSRSLFDELVKKGVHNDYEICAENITGGVGKNLFRAKQTSKPIILIGGYNFYLSALGQGIGFTSLILYHLHGALAPLIVNDLIRWKE